MPTELYIQLGDWAEGAKYLRWFHKNFPDNSGFPDFLFEWTIIAFKSGDIKKAEKIVFSVFCSNTYFNDKFFGRPIVPLEKFENSNIDIPEFVDNLSYSCEQSSLADFADWLDNFTRSENFGEASQKFIEIYRRLKIEKDLLTRHYLTRQAQQLEERF